MNKMIKTSDGYSFIFYEHESDREDITLKRNASFYQWMDQRRSVRDFSIPAQTHVLNERNNTWDLASLKQIIQDRKNNPIGGSYTTSLFESGINKVAQKVGEEAIELVIEAKDNNKELFLNEAADLMYHYLVLLTAKGYVLSDVQEVLKKRHFK